jgi:type 1 glutamine amidotransferase
MHKKALIFWGGWQGHAPERSANVVKDILSDNGFDVRIEQGTSALANPAIGDFNLIVPVVTMSTIEKPDSIT